MKKITDKIKKEIVQLRAEGLSYPKIGKRVDLSVTSVSKVVKEHRIKDEPIEATIMKPCPNPRIIMIYFGEKENNVFFGHFHDNHHKSPCTDYRENDQKKRGYSEEQPRY